MIIEMK